MYARIADMYAERRLRSQYICSPGTLLHDRYIVGRVLGYGGFGVTYIGWDGKLEQKVAIKEYLPGEFSNKNARSVTGNGFQRR